MPHALAVVNAARDRKLRVLVVLRYGVEQGRPCSGQAVPTTVCMHAGMGHMEARCIAELLGVSPSLSVGAGAPSSRTHEQFCDHRQGILLKRESRALVWMSVAFVFSAVFDSACPKRPAALSQT